MDNLDFYASIENLIPFNEQVQKLYGAHLKELKKLGVKSTIDIGCGNGSFVKLLLENGLESVGVDLSPVMVAKAKQNGVDARAVNICDIKDEKYECATAVFDVLNYIHPDNLVHFLDCVVELLVDGGYFLADINTYHGFADVADGDARFYDNSRDLFVSARFENDELVSDFTLYELDDTSYKKTNSKIHQYYHDKSAFKGYKKMSLIKALPTKLFSDKADKELLIFRKN